MEFQGFKRQDGSYGVRNHVLVLSSVSCSGGKLSCINVNRSIPFNYLKVGPTF